MIPNGPNLIVFYNPIATVRTVTQQETEGKTRTISSRKSQHFRLITSHKSITFLLGN